MGSEPTKDDVALKQAVLTFYRDELRQRYQLENVRRFDSFSDISDQQITELREFFLEQIYPEAENRDKLDRAFDRLHGMLRSPKRMQPLMGAALSSLWKIGHRLPSAISAGRATIDAYIKTRLLEQEMIDEARRQKLKPEDYGEHHHMIKLIQGVPERQVMTLIQDILVLFRALTNVEVLKVAVAFMEQCIGVMEKRDDLYTEEDLEGVNLGLSLLREGLDLFQNVDKQNFPRIINGIHSVELDWYHRVQAEANAPA